MNEQQQESFFHSIFNLPTFSVMIGEATHNRSPAITIRTSSWLRKEAHSFTLFLFTGIGYDRNF
jgi:hypothetical protein